MGVLRLFKFTLRCVDIFAWPIMAFIYPLYASVQVMETRSSADMQKLFSYWISFSLIMLLEHVSGWLLQCLPLWPYVKLMGVCWLVAPYFDGSFYVYEHFVRPFLSADANSRHLSMLMEFLCKKVILPLELEMTEGKQITPANFDVDITLKANVEEPIAADKDIKTTAEAVEMQVIPYEQVGQMKLDLALVKNKTLEVTNRVPCIPTGWQEQLRSKGIDLRDDSSWNCIICSLSYGYESSIYSHLLEKKHTSRIRALESEGVEVRNLEFCCTICDVRCSRRGIMELHINGKKHLSRIRAWERKGVVVIKFKWLCTICDISCTSRGNMEHHLNGKKHLAKKK